MQNTYAYNIKTKIVSVSNTGRTPSDSRLTDQIDYFMKRHPNAVIKDISPYGYSYIDNDDRSTIVVEKALITYVEK